MAILPRAAHCKRHLHRRRRSRIVWERRSAVVTQAHPAAVAPAAPRSTGDCAPRSATHRPTPCIYPRSSPPLLRPPRRRRGQPRPARAARLQKRPRRFRKWPAIRRRGSGGSGRRSAAEAAAVPRPSLRPVRFRFGSEGRGGVAAVIFCACPANLFHSCSRQQVPCASPMQSQLDKISSTSCR